MNQITIFCLFCNNEIDLFRSVVSSAANPLEYHGICYCEDTPYFKLKILNKYTEYFNLNNNHDYFYMVSMSKTKKLHLFISKVNSKFKLRIVYYQDEFKYEFDKFPGIEFLKNKISLITLLS